MIRRNSFLGALLLFVVGTVALQGQARFALYGAFGGEKSGLPNQSWTLAKTAGFYVGMVNAGPLAVSVDGRADLSSNVNTGLVGPRVALHFPLVPFKPYAELLLGFSDFSRTGAGLKDPNQFASRVVFGVDTAILPHIDWRVADVSYGLNNSANGDHAITITTGVVLRL